jgi:hypothetical protein
MDPFGTQAIDFGQGNCLVIFLVVDIDEYQDGTTFGKLHSQLSTFLFYLFFSIIKKKIDDVQMGCNRMNTYPILWLNQ